MAVIYMSGYSDALVSRGGVEAGTLFLEKPFSPVQLEHKVREALDGQDRTGAGNRG